MARYELDDADDVESVGDALAKYAKRQEDEIKNLAKQIEELESDLEAARERIRDLETDRGEG